MNEPYDIFFTGNTDPRECIMIGGVGGIGGAFYLEFRTPHIPAVETQTLIFRNGDHEPVAAFEWTLDTHPGTAVIQGRSLHMSQLVQIDQNTPAHVRSFQTPDGQRFYWRRLEGTRSAYELYVHGPNHPIAHFESSGMTNSPIGPCHAHMQCWLTDETQLLYASLALCLNRWIDWRGL